MAAKVKLRLGQKMLLIGKRDSAVIFRGSGKNELYLPNVGPNARVTGSMLRAGMAAAAAVGDHPATRIFQKSFLDGLAKEAARRVHPEAIAKAVKRNGGKS